MWPVSFVACRVFRDRRRLDQELDEIGLLAGPGLGEDPLEVEADGLVAHRLQPRDLLQRRPARHARRDAALGRGQPIVPAQIRIRRPLRGCGVIRKIMALGWSWPSSQALRLAGTTSSETFPRRTGSATTRVAAGLGGGFVERRGRSAISPRSCSAVRGSWVVSVPSGSRFLQVGRYVITPAVEVPARPATAWIARHGWTA